MTPLFRRLQPAQKFRISPSSIARLLKIPRHLIVRVESWAYIVFVHRRDKGGQFISYRRLRQWFNAMPVKFNIAPPANNCGNCGWRLNAIANGTISNTMTRMPNYYTIFGKGAGIQ